MTWAAWTAGIIDGEGCITIVPRRRTDRTCIHDGWMMSVHVGNTDRRMVEKLQELWGGSIWEKRERGPNRADSYHWQASGRKALDLLLSCRPFLVVKAEQAALALAFQARLSAGVGFRSGMASNRRSGLSTEEIVVRERMYQDMKHLNIKPGVRQNGGTLDSKGF